MELRTHAATSAAGSEGSTPVNASAAADAAIALGTAVAIEPPIYWTVFTAADATPASSARTPRARMHVRRPGRPAEGQLLPPGGVGGREAAPTPPGDGGVSSRR